MEVQQLAGCECTDPPSDITGWDRCKQTHHAQCKSERGSGGKKIIELEAGPGLEWISRSFQRLFCTFVHLRLRSTSRWPLHRWLWRTRTIVHSCTPRFDESLCSGQFRSPLHGSLSCVCMCVCL